MHYTRNTQKVVEVIVMIYIITNYFFCITNYHLLFQWFVTSFQTFLQKRTNRMYLVYFYT